MDILAEPLTADEEEKMLHMLIPLTCVLTSQQHVEMRMQDGEHSQLKRGLAVTSTFMIQVASSQSRLGTED